MSVQLYDGAGKIRRDIKPVQTSKYACTIVTIASGGNSALISFNGAGGQFTKFVEDGMKGIGTDLTVHEDGVQMIEFEWAMNWSMTAFVADDTIIMRMTPQSRVPGGAYVAWTSAATPPAASRAVFDSVHTLGTGASANSLLCQSYTSLVKGPVPRGTSFNFILNNIVDTGARVSALIDITLTVKIYK